MAKVCWKISGVLIPHNSKRARQDVAMIVLAEKPEDAIQICREQLAGQWAVQITRVLKVADYLLLGPMTKEDIATLCP